MADSSKSFSEAFNKIPQPAWIYDTSTLSILAVNDAAVEKYGYCHSEFTSMTIKNIRPEEDITVLIDDVNHSEPGLNISRSWRHRKKDGTVFNVEIQSNEIIFEGKKARVVLATDITERSKTEKRLEIQYGVTQAIAGLGSESEVLLSVQKIIGTGLNFDFSELWCVDESYSHLYLSSTWDASPGSDKKISTKVKDLTSKKGDGLPGRIWQSLRPLWIGNLQQDLHFNIGLSAEESILKTAIAFPVMQQEEFLGVFCFFKTSYYVPDAEMLQMLESLGSQIGNFIAKKRIEREKNKLIEEIAGERKRLENIVANVPGIVWEGWGVPDAASQRINFISDYVEKMLGYPVEEWLSTPDFWLSVIHPDDRERVAKNSAEFFLNKKGGIDRFRWITKSGETIWIESHSTVILDANNKPVGMRGVNMDITRRKLVEDEINSRIRQHAATASLGTKALKGIMPDELIDDAVLLIKDVLNCQYVKVLKYIPDENTFILKAGAGMQKGLVGNIKVGAGRNSQAGYTLLHNKPIVVNDIRTEKRFKKAALLFDDKIVSGISVVIRGKEYPFGVISAHTTVPRSFTNDDTYFLGTIANIITTSIERKKAESDLELSLKEKEVLLKEIHHRVKNNLQVISSLLSLQSRSIKDSEALEAFSESQNRIKSMALIHEKLYQSQSFLKVNFEEYVRDLTRNLLDSYSVGANLIEPVIMIKNIFINIDTAIALGLIINELASNSIKHAFTGEDEETGKKKNISFEINMSSSKEYCLTIKDNGRGLPLDLDLNNTSTLGLLLVKTLVDQIEGKIEINSNGGVEFKISFPE